VPAKTLYPAMFQLKHEWVLWEMIGDKSAKRQHWSESLHEVGRFDTVEGFWL
jgi:Eukaryotic initiation factor 4E